MNPKPSIYRNMLPTPNSDTPFESLKTPSSSSHHPPNPNPNPNPNPKQDHDPPQFLIDLPSQVFDDHELPLNQIFLQSQLISRNPHNIPNEDPLKRGSKKKMDPAADQANRRRNLGTVPRRRTGKKDRHSKICTAQGIRDRRMRLSLQVARKFFDLQDMLGYDKASKTIEWLFTKSKKAIKELSRSHDEYDIVLSDEESPKSDCKSNVRESRDKARERARSRTREKMVTKQIDHQSQSGSIKLGFSNSQFQEGTIEKFLGNSTAQIASFCPMSDYLYCCSPTHYTDFNNFVGISGNWEMMNIDRTNQDSSNSVYSPTADFS